MGSLSSESVERSLNSQRIHTNWKDDNIENVRACLSGDIVGLLNKVRTRGYSEGDPLIWSLDQLLRSTWKAIDMKHLDVVDEALGKIKKDKKLY